MGTMINISVTGFVGSEPQVREVGEQRVASFSVAVNRKNGSGRSANPLGAGQLLEQARWCR